MRLFYKIEESHKFGVPKSLIFLKKNESWARQSIEFTLSKNYTLLLIADEFKGEIIYQES